jgi:hypothetical protein
VVDRERLASWGKSLLVVILIAQLLGLLIIFRGEGDGTDPGQNAQAPPAQGESPSTKQSASPKKEEGEGESDDSAVAHEDTSEPAFSGAAINSQAGYRFRYPAGWEVEHIGTAIEVTSPDRKAKVTFGLAPAGDLRSASRKTVSAIQDEYGDVIVSDLDTVSVGGRPARLVQGKATNADGVRLLFRSVTVGGKNEVFAILAFEAAGSEEEMRSEIGGIVETFRQTRSGARSVSVAPTPTGSTYSVSAS